MGAPAGIPCNTDSMSGMLKKLLFATEEYAVDLEKLKTTPWVGLTQLQVYLTF